MAADDKIENVEVDTSPGLPAVPPPKVQTFSKAKVQAKVVSNANPGVAVVDMDGVEIAIVCPINMPPPEVGAKIDLEADKSGDQIVRYLFKPQPPKVV